MARVGLRSTAGYTLMEILVATGLLGILATGFSVTSMAFFKHSQQSNLQISRDQVVVQLRVVATHQKSIFKSLKDPANAAFRNCACGIGTCTNMKEPFAAFTLLDSSGSIQSPAYYDSSGVSCDPLNPRCLIRVRTTFFAQCQPDLASPSQNPRASCDGTPAEFVGIFYVVDENPNSAKLPIAHLKPVSGPIYLQTADIPAGACL
jgi:prepilin-type N-terminal cleavage/methylation domain-containing protein